MTVMSLMWSAALLLLFAVSHVRLLCDSGASFTATCNTVNQRKSFLLYERALTERIQCRQTDSGNSYRWTLSPDGTEINSMDLNVTSNKYVIDGRNLSITLSNVTGEDGGLYRCAYGDGGVTLELCIKVYERAVFESCPSEFTGCSGSTQLSATAGESVVFDASVTYTPGGSCDFQQMLSRVMLWRINEEFGVPNSLMFSCSTTDGEACTMNDPRISWSRGNKPGLHFMFTLNSTRLDDNSLYRVTVLGMHPQTGVETTLTKVFDLQVNPAPTSDPIVTPTSLPRTESSTTPAINNNPVGEISSGDNRAVVAGVLVPLLVVILVVVVLGLLFLVVRWKQGSLPSPLHLYKSSGIRKDAITTKPDGVDTPRRAESIRIVSRTEVQPLGNVPNILINIEDSVVVSLPPENSRMSFVDSNMHELPSRLQDHEPLNLPLFDQSNTEKTLESPGVPV